MTALTRTLAFAALALLWLVMLMAGTSPADRALLGLLYAGDATPLAHAAGLLTHLGGWIVLTAVTAAAALYLLLKRRLHDALLLLAVTMGGRAMMELQKYVVGRARPDELEHLASFHSLSFPSGHATNATTVYLAIALLLFPSRWSVAAALLLALLIGLTRPILGVHWPSDVVGGWAFGLLWTLGLIRLVGTRGTPAPVRH
ncbi:MAG TPA: phosphatase PAP2 family protein [Allosphingosinicella sp.]|uniref:phosphatase PAP2 family protein n=1 Tax=Allosphingosinicella sp. TaxID=2823234 RepID=UPI002ED7AB01